MQIQQNYQNLFRNTNSEVKPKFISKNNAVQIIPAVSTSESTKKTNEEFGCYLSYNIAKKKNVVSEPNVEVKAQTNNTLSQIENPDSNSDHDIYYSKMNNIIKKLGINGNTISISKESIPQNYTSYYIEIENSAKNMVIYELENGALVFTETTLDPNTLQTKFGEARYDLGLNDGKLDVDDLKKALAAFYDVEELKDLFKEFFVSKEKARSYSRY